jgi:uroporphyrin-III C-methyltransferase
MGRGSEAMARQGFPAIAPGSVWLVGAGPGDPGLLTLHAVHALEQADVILHDALVAPEILGLCGRAARLEPVGKRAGWRSSKQLEINQRLIDLARENLRVVRLKGGDPLVFGRGGEEALALAAAGVPFRIVPGVTAGHGALAYAGVPATHRGLAQSVAFVTGHHAGGGAARDVDWAALAKGAHTLVVDMAWQRLPAIADALLAAGRDPQDPVAILCDATTPRQRLCRTTLSKAAAVAAEVDRSSATLIAIGPVVALSDLLMPWLEAAPAVLPPAEPDQLLALQG